MADDPGPKGVVFSLVIPAYNEASRLPASLARARAYLDAKGAPYEVLVVDDGSTDATADQVKALAAEWPALRLVRGPHRGKGAAVREGLLAAQGEWVAIADADLSMPVEEFDRFTEGAAGPCDIFIGSREAPGARRFGEPAYRHAMGRGFNALVRLLLLPGIQDTQCGFKRLRRAVALDLCRRQTIAGWGFDVELLYIARRRGYTMREVGIDWYYMPDSRVSPLRDTLTMLRDVLQIGWNARRGAYDAAVPAETTTSTERVEGAPTPARDG
jgi:glycosyltransferase involved in cell wall biosynthesis